MYKAKVSVSQLRLAELGVLFSLLASSPATAQITPDATLPVNSLVTNQGNTSIINGGTRAGSNLFHSFEKFSVPTGSTAYFNNALDVQNIINRVTGSSISNIDGLLQANGKANLFLINPNGFIFGRNASLFIGGSFLASTANSLKFADGTQFSATTPQTTPLLTISVPLGLQFGGNPGRILVQGDGQGTRTTSDLIDTTIGLRVQPSQTLAMVGGDVNLEGGTLKTAGGRIELGSVTGPSLVSLTSVNKGWVLGYSGVQNFKDINLSQQATVDASGKGGGDIQVRGRRVTLTDGSQIETSTLGAEPGGALTVIASEFVQVIGITPFSTFASTLSAQVYPGATGSGSNLTVGTGRLILQNGAQVFTSTASPGSSGTLAVNASESVELIGVSPYSEFPTSVSSLVGPGATGSGGNLTLETRQLSIRQGAVVSTSTFGAGKGSDLLVKAKDSVEVFGSSADGQRPSRLTARARGAGNAGNVTIQTGQLDVRSGAELNVSSRGSGRAGSLQAQARSIRLDNQGKLTAETASGNGGSITLQVQDLLLLRRDSEISTNAGGTGNGGNITLNTNILAALGNSGITANAVRGRGGNIQINAKGIFRSPDSDLTASSQLGINGTVQINTPDVDPSSGVLTLPTQPINITGLIAQGCPGTGSDVARGASEFFITGRGGLPLQAGKPLRASAVVVNGDRLEAGVKNRDRTATSTPVTRSTPPQMVEAQGWAFNDKGEVTLTAYPVSTTPDSSALTQTTCYAP